MSSDAFVFLNHWLDVVEVMEEGEGTVDYSELVSTDFPQQVPLPEKRHISDGDMEAVRDWVLTVSMDRNIETVCILEIYISFLEYLIHIFNIVLDIRFEDVISYFFQQNHSILNNLEAKFPLLPCALLVRE